MECYVPITSKKTISEIISHLVGTHITLHMDSDGNGVAEVRVNNKRYRLTYKNCQELENGTTQGSLTKIEQIFDNKTHIWRHSALVH